MVQEWVWSREGAKAGWKAKDWGCEASAEGWERDWREQVGSCSRSGNTWHWDLSLFGGARPLLGLGAKDLGAI